MNELKALAERLRYFNSWRRDDDGAGEMPNPKQIGTDIDAAIIVIEEVAKEERSAERYKREVKELIEEMKRVGVNAEYFGGFSELSEVGRLILACAKLLQDNIDEMDENEAS